MNAQIKQGQDVLYVHSNGDVAPAKVIRQTSGNEYSIVVFSEAGNQTLKKIRFAQNAEPGCFYLQPANEAQQQEKSTGAAGGHSSR